MLPPESKARLERLVSESGYEIANLTPDDAIRLMVAFYRNVRVQNCIIDEDGDMLLFQWGVLDLGDGETYHYDITRQFIVPDGKEEEMSQLRMTIEFPVTGSLRAIKAGDRWCFSPDGIDKFKRFILDHEVTKAVSSLTPLRTTLAWERV